MKRWTCSLGLLGLLMGGTSAAAWADTSVRTEARSPNRWTATVRTERALRRACRDGGVVSGDLIIEGRRVQDTEALRCLRRVSGDLVVQHTSIHRLTGLERLEAVGGELVVQHNDALEVLGPWSALRRVDDDVVVRHNPRLQRMATAPALQEIGGELQVHGAAIRSLDGLTALSEVDAIWLETPELGDLLALHQLRRVPGHLRLGHTHRLRDLRGLDQLESVGGDLEVASHRSLHSLDGLGRLEHVGGRLSIGNAPALVALRGLTRLSAVGALDLVLSNSVSDLGPLERVQQQTADVHLDAPGIARPAERVVAR